MAKESKKDNKNKRHFFKDFKAELKKVIWPTPKQLVKSTMAVVFIVVVTAVIVFVLDVVFETINSKGINALKSSIKNSRWDYSWNKICTFIRKRAYQFSA